MIGEVTMLKRKIINIIIGLLICICGGLCLISKIKFNKDRDRNIINCTITSDLKSQVAQISNNSDTPQDIIKKCSNVACETLSFTAKNDIQNGKANCVGYAQLTSTLINHAFQIKNLSYHAKPVVGKVYLFGIDLNNISQKILPPKHRPFFKDHDFVEIDLGNKTVYIDSSLQDLTGFSYIQVQNK